jgi:hypothetical protein
MISASAPPPRGAIEPPIWHVTVNGAPACSASELARDERLEFPACSSRNRLRLEEYAAVLRPRHSAASIEVAPYGCPMRGE